MPVLSEPHHGIAQLPSSKPTYLLLGAIFLLFVGIFISRRRKTRASTSQPNDTSSSPFNEKSIQFDELEPQSAPVAKPRIPLQRPPQPLPFTPPTLLSQSPVQSPTEMTFMAFESFDSFEPEALGGQGAEMPPRRRSYTKSTGVPGGEVEVSGEIIVAEGWRRHTRVFGGGVCKACEESERRMSA